MDSGLFVRQIVYNEGMKGRNGEWEMKIIN